MTSVPQNKVVKPPVVSAPQQALPAAGSSFDTYDVIFRLADRIKNSSIIPKDYLGKPENIAIAMIMGREIGLHPIQSVQSIMVVNGRPTVWGDALPGLCYASGLMEKFEESFDEKSKTATCIVRRKGDPADHISVFSWADAVTAGLDKKPGPWQQYPKRQLKMRARAFALRDKFADVLKGLQVREEVEDYQILDGNKSAVLEPVALSPEIPASPAPEPANVVPAEVVPTPEPVADKDAARLDKALQNFSSHYGYSLETLKAWISWKKFKSNKDAVAALADLWMKGKVDPENVKVEFGRFVPSQDAGDAQEPSDDTPLFK